MQKSFNLLFIAAAIAVVSSCHTAKNASNSTTPKEAPIKVVNADPIVVTDTRIAPKAPVTYSLPVYNAAATRLTDLLHTRLEVSFDWQKQYLMGKATLTAQPYFYATDMLILDAKGFEIKSVALVGKAEAKTPPEICV